MDEISRVYDAFQMGRIDQPFRLSQKHNSLGMAAARTSAKAASESAWAGIPCGIYHRETATLMAIVLDGVVYERF